MRLAALHEENRDVLKADPLNYHAGDAKDARAAAQEILGALGEETREAWADLRNRAYTLLVDRHEELCAAGQYLFRRDAEVRDRFASLRMLTAVRSGSRAKKPPVVVPPAPPPPPAPQPTPGDGELPVGP